MVAGTGLDGVGDGELVGRGRSELGRRDQRRYRAARTQGKRAGAGEPDRRRTPVRPTVTCAPRTPTDRLGPDFERLTDTPGNRRIRQYNRKLPISQSHRYPRSTREAARPTAATSSRASTRPSEGLVVIRRILTHLGLPTEVPAPRPPPSDLFDWS